MPDVVVDRVAQLEEAIRFIQQCIYECDGSSIIYYLAHFEETESSKLIKEILNTPERAKQILTLRSAGNIWQKD